ncbi:MAG TPA: hypothetical protein ENN23_09915 [Deltaproteobacteria bacterium]|nr:hypothetical protein [Deltaproteobacteria bacterium]
MNEQQHNQILDSIIALTNQLAMMIAIINGEARDSKLGVNATITDIASTRIGNTVAQERHGNDISREQ